MTDTPRKISFLTIESVLKKKPITSLFGFLFTFLPILPIFVLFLASSIFSPLGNENIDYELIKSKGKVAKAKITDIETQYNTTINGVHPTTISYVYSKNEKKINAIYKVLEVRKIAELKIGDDIEIIELDEVSIIKGLKPFDFPIGIFLAFLVPFMIIGIPLLIYTIVSLRKELRLYKYGKESGAKLISMIPKAGLPITNIGKGVIVHYEYETKGGQKIIGESLTTDFSIMSEKKKGDFIPIFISNENEEKSCIVPKLSALRNGWNIEFE